MSRTLTTLLLVVAFLGPTVAAVIANQRAPSLNSALTVAYASFAGLALGIVLTIVVWLLSRRWPALAPRGMIVAIAALLALACYPMADAGMISAVR